MTKNLLLFALFAIVNIKSYSQTYPDSSYDSSKKSKSIVARYDHSDDAYEYFYVHPGALEQDFERHYFAHLCLEKGFLFANISDIETDSVLCYTKRGQYGNSGAILDTLFEGVKSSSADYEISDLRKKIDCTILSKLKENDPENSAKSTLTQIQVPCSTASVSCTALPVSFASNANNSTTQYIAPPVVNGYPFYGCLGSQPCPKFFYLQVAQNGDINMHITQTSNGEPPAPLDVDFICWGPFNSLNEGCETGLTQAKMVDCSFSALAVEDCNIPNAQVGEIYILLITNYAGLGANGTPGFVSFSETISPGSGVTNCDIVTYCGVVAVTANTTACSAATNTYNVSGNIEFTNPPFSGTLTVTDLTAIPNVSQTINVTAGFTSPQPYSFSNIYCDGAVHTITAAFSAIADCFLTDTYNAPVSNCPMATISGGGPICDNGTATADVVIDINGLGPFTFVYKLDGVDQPAITGFNGPFPYVITTGTTHTYSLVSVSNAVCAGTVSGAVSTTMAPLPVPVIDGSTDLCAGTTGSAYSTQSGQQGYLWTISAGGTITAGQTTNSVTVDWNTAGAQTLTVSYLGPAPSNCAPLEPTVYNVNVAEIPTASAGLDATVCQGQAYAVSGATVTHESSYSWMVITGLGTLTGTGTLTPTYTPTPDETGDVVLSLNVSGTSTCLPLADQVTIHILPPVSATAGPDFSVCQNNTFTIASAVASNYSSLLWTHSGTGTLTEETTLSPEYTPGEGESGNIVLTLTALANAPCNNASSQVIITVYASPISLSLSGQEIISNDTTLEVLPVSQTGPGSLSWTATASSPLVTGFIASGSGSAIPVQIITSSSSAIEHVMFSILPENTDCPGMPLSHIVTVYPYPTAPITTAMDAAGLPNKLVKVPVQVKGNQSITSLSLRLEYNPEHATYQSFTDVNPAFSGLIINEVVVSPSLHKIMLSWAEIAPVQISQNTLIANLVFAYFSDTTDLIWNNNANNGQDCEYADEAGNQLNDLPSWFCYQNGKIYPGIGINGTFKYLNSAFTPLDSIKLYLYGNNGLKDSTQTNGAGEYMFVGLTNGSYQIKAISAKPWSGVNSTDAAKIQRHFTGIEVLTEPIKLLAGDVNNSNFINATDALQVKRRFAGLTNYFLRGDWAFAMTVSGGDTLVINGANLSQDFYGLCVGDVNGSNIPDAGGKKSAGLYLGSSGTIEVTPGEVFEVPVKAVYPMQLSAISMVIPYPADYFEAIQVTMDGLDPVYNIANGEIRIAWSEMENLGLNAGDALLKLKFRAKETFTGNLSVELRPTAESELADEKGEAIPAPELSSLIIVPMNANGLPGDNTLIGSCSVFPNPARDIVNIEIRLEKPAAITCQILDATGREIGTVEEKEFEQGIARIAIATGQYSAGLYQLRIKVRTKEKSLVFMEKVVIEK